MASPPPLADTDADRPNAFIRSGAAGRSPTEMEFRSDEQEMGGEFLSLFCALAASKIAETSESRFTELNALHEHSRLM